jgi:hypothetical protein
MYTIEEQFLYEENKPKNIQQKLYNEFNNITYLLNNSNLKRDSDLKRYGDYFIKFVVNDRINKTIKEDFKNYKKEIEEYKFIKSANEEFHKNGRTNRDGILGGNKTTYKLYNNKKTNLAYINYNNKKSYFYENDNKIYIKIDDKIVYLTKQSISYDEKLNSYFVKL